ncbi:hypothetical protein N7490_009193 [Penicillium lividum]|nr:hypothetical protein N7490_009193 [Penicillium lividum]
MSTTDVQRLVHKIQPQMYQEKTLNDSPDTHLLRVFEVLQYNRTVLESLSSLLRQKFHGLDTILSWDIKFDEDLEDVTMIGHCLKKAAMFRDLDLSDSQGLARTHDLILTILNYMALGNRPQEIWALLSVGLWTDVLPDPDELSQIFYGDNIVMRLSSPLIQDLLTTIPNNHLEISRVPFELWSILNQARSRQDAPTFSQVAMIKSLKYVIRILMAANLITGRTETLIDGKQGYRLHPALTLWLRHILETQVCLALHAGFFVCMEDRAIKMADLNLDVREAQTAILSSAFPFIEREKWNLMAAVSGMHQRYHLFRAFALTPAWQSLLSNVPTFAWQSFNILAPICALTEDFCTWFLTHFALKYIEMRASLTPKSIDQPMADPIGPFLNILNWAVMMAQRYRLEDKLIVPLGIRRMLLDYLKDRRSTGRKDEELFENNLVAAEIRGWLNELWITLKAPQSTEEDVDRIVKMINITTQGFGAHWEMRMDPMLNSNMLEIIRGDHDMAAFERYIQESWEKSAQSTDSFASEIAGRTMTLEFLLEKIKYFRGESHPIVSPMSLTWTREMFQFVEELQFFRSLPPWYIDKIRDMFTHIRQGDLPQAISAAEEGLRLAENDGHVLVAANFRQICSRLGDLDSGSNYDAHQAQIIRAKENLCPFLSEILDCLASHDTPMAYIKAILAHAEMNLGVGLLSTVLPFIQGELPQPMQNLVENMPERMLALEGLEQLVALLEPYKDSALEDRKKWVQLLQSIWDLTADLVGQTTPEYLKWLTDVRDKFPQGST